MQPFEAEQQRRRRRPAPQSIRSAATSCSTSKDLAVSIITPYDEIRCLVTYDTAEFSTRRQNAQLYMLVLYVHTHRAPHKDDSKKYRAISNPYYIRTRTMKHLDLLRTSEGCSHIPEVGAIISICSTTSAHILFMRHYPDLSASLHAIREQKAARYPHM